MRKVIMSAFISLDGVMQAPGGPTEDPSDGFAHGGWLPQHWDETVGEFLGELFDRPFDLLLGRRTYDIFAGYWPYQEGDIAGPFNAATKYVASRSDIPLPWAGSVLLNDAVADVARLKGEDGPDLIIQGSANLMQSLQRANLIDTYHLLTFPVLLGGGKRLFEDGVEPGTLKPVSGKVTVKGAIIATYAPGGAIETGSFGDDKPPSDLELARRQKIAEGTW